MNDEVKTTDVVDPTAKVAAQFSKTEAGLAELKSLYAGKVYDCTNNKGDGEARHARQHLKDMRGNVEKLRVMLKAPVLEEGRIIDAEANRIKAELEALEAPIDKQIKAEERRRAELKQAAERAEAERVAKIDTVIRWLRERPGLYAAGNAATLLSLIAEIRSKAANGFESYGDGHEKIAEQVTATLQQLETMLEQRKQADAEAERLRLQREELAEIERKLEAKRAETERQQAELDEQRRAAQCKADDALVEALTEPALKPSVALTIAEEQAQIAAQVPLTGALSIGMEADPVEAAPPPVLGADEPLEVVAREAYTLLLGLLPGHTTTIKLGNVLGLTKES